MTLLLLLAVGSAGAVATALALPRGGRAAQVAAVGGVVAMALVGVLAVASATPDASSAGTLGGPAGTLFNGALVPGAYLRTAIALWSASSIAVSAIVWLLRGTPALRGVMPAALGAQVGAAVALAASTPELGIVAGGATGLASIPVLLASSRPRVGVAAREVRIAVATAAVALGVAAATATLSRLVLASPQASTEGSGVAAAAAFGVLALALAVAARVGVFPYHVRVSALADAVPDGALPLVLVWLPFPLVAAAVDLASGPFASLAVPIGGAQALLLVLLVLATIAAAVAAGLQDDLRHAVGYLTIADLGLVVLVFTALSDAAWAPARVWLLSVAVTKTALAAWAAVVEDRFASRSVPDLRGWLRPSPVLGVALALIVLATYGLPGWAVLTARVDLAQAATSAPWSTAVLAASLLTLPAYARWAWVGVGAPTSHVDRAAPDLIAARWWALPARRLTTRPPRRSRRRDEALPVEQERHPDPDVATSTVAARGGRAASTPDGRVPPARRATAVGSAPEVHAPSRPAPGRPSGLRVTVSGPPRAAEPAVVAGTELPVAPSAATLPAGTAAEQLGAFTPEPDAPAGPSTERAGAGPGATPPSSDAPASPLGATDSDAGSFATAEASGVTPAAADDGGPAAPAANAAPAVHVTARSRAAGRRTKPSAMSTPRPPEASRALPLDVDPAADEAPAGSTTAVARVRRTAGPSAATRAAASVRARRTDVLSAMVLTLALLAAVVAFGGFDVAGAAREATPAGPVVNAAGN